MPLPKETQGIRYQDFDLPIHDHGPAAHWHEVWAGETELYDENGVFRIQKPGMAPAWFRPGRRHGIRCRVKGTVYFNSTPV